MELNQLRGFLAVADLLHFGKAAEQVHVSQPALSLQIRSLENELGVRLLERTPQKTSLTPAGVVYRDEVRQVLACADRAIARTRLAAEGKIGRLRLGFISTAAAYVVPPLLARFRRNYPDVELECLHVLTGEQISMLENRFIDIGLFRLPISGHPDLATIPIHKEPFKLFVPGTHPLARFPNLRLEDIDGVNFLIYSRKNAPGFHDLELRLLHDHAVVPATIREASDMYTLVSLVSAGAGVAIAPASLINYRIPGVVVCDVLGLPPSEIALAFRKDCTHPLILSFVKLALEFRLDQGAGDAD